MITIEVFQVIKEEDDSYTASLKFIESTTGKTIKKQTVSAWDLEGFKIKIRLYKAKIEEIDNNKKTLLALVQRAIDEVMEE